MLSFVLLCLGFAVVPSLGEVQTGTIAVNVPNFWFLGRFSFDATANPSPPDPWPGQITVTLTTTPGDAPKLPQLEILLYDDEDQSWPAVYKQDLTCSQWRAAAKNWDPISQDVFSEYRVSFPNNATVWFSNPLIGETARQRFWYAVLSTCGVPTSTGYVQYHVHFVNLLSSSWNSEFGYDQQGLNSLYVIFFIFYFLLLAIHLFGVRRSYKTLKYFHPLIRLFSAVLFIQFLFVAAKMIHFVRFAEDGKGNNFLYYAGSILEIIARVLFILLIMLLAEGWTITSGSLRGKGFIILAIIAFTVLWVAIGTYTAAVQDPANTQIETPLQNLNIILLTVWFLLAAWFFMTVYNSQKKEDVVPKKQFYIRMGVIFGAWFIILPIATASALSLDPWLREKTSESVDVVITSLAFAAMAFLLWPSRAEAYFKLERPNQPSGNLPNYDHL